MLIRSLGVYTGLVSLASYIPRVYNSVPKAAWAYIRMKMISMKLSDEEVDAIDERAESAGMSRTAYMVKAALGEGVMAGPERPVSSPFDEDGRLRPGTIKRERTRIGEGASKLSSVVMKFVRYDGDREVWERLDG